MSYHYVALHLQSVSHCCAMLLQNEATTAANLLNKHCWDPRGDSESMSHDRGPHLRYKRQCGEKHMTHLDTMPILLITDSSWVFVIFTVCRGKKGFLAENFMGLLVPEKTAFNSNFSHLCTMVMYFEINAAISAIMCHVHIRISCFLICISGVSSSQDNEPDSSVIFPGEKSAGRFSCRNLYDGGDNGHILHNNDASHIQ